MRPFLLSVVLCLFFLTLGAGPSNAGAKRGAKPKREGACRCCDHFSELSEAIGIYKIDSPEAGDWWGPLRAAYHPALLWTAAVEPLVSLHPGMKELSDLFLSVPRPSRMSLKQVERFRSQLEDIVRRHGQGLELAWPAGIDTILERYQAEGLIKKETNLGPAAIVIPYRPYGLMVESGVLPVLDIHDIISHLPGFFLFPEYRQLFSDRAHNINRLEDLLEKHPAFREATWRPGMDVFKRVGILTARFGRKPERHWHRYATIG